MKGAFIFWGTAITIAVTAFCLLIYAANHTETTEQSCYRNMPILYTYNEARADVSRFMEDKMVTDVECRKARILYDQIHLDRARNDKVAEFERVRKMVDGGRK